MLSGKVALVTGASRGIGRETAISLASQGAFVFVNYSGNDEAANEVVNTIKAQGGLAEAYKCSVSDFSAVKEMIDYIVKEHKRIDIIVNNAGITKDNILLKMSESDFDEVLDINLKGAFNTVKHAVRYMLKQRSGKIINISSVVGVIGNPGQINYCSAKAGLIGLTKSLAKEVAAKGIQVNAVAPGFIETSMTEVLTEEQKNNMIESIPMKRSGKPEDIAKAVLFLASEQSDYITGQVLEVNGGMNM